MVLILDNIKKIQKKRIKRNFKKPKIKFGDFAIVSKNEGRLELIQLSHLKKKLKNLIKKKKSEIDQIREKIWYFSRFNFLIQKKSKNSRMGKGKGLIERKVIILKKNSIIFEFKGISVIKIIKIIKFFNKVLNVKTYFFKKNLIFFSLWSKKNKYIIYHDKYLYQ